MLDEHFRQLDRDGSGTITISELEAYFQAVTLDPALTLAATNGVRVQNDY